MTREDYQLVKKILDYYKAGLRTYPYTVSKHDQLIYLQSKYLDQGVCHVSHKIFNTVIKDRKWMRIRESYASVWWCKTPMVLYWSQGDIIEAISARIIILRTIAEKPRKRWWQFWRF